MQEQLQQLNVDVLEDFIRKSFVPSNMVIIGCGVDENQFVETVKKQFVCYYYFRNNL